MTGHGGVRPGAGRPALEEKRKMRSMRAFDDEWDIIQKFADFVKSDKKDECVRFVDRVKSED